jgi:putative ABC transport system ATP-binding protein
MENLPAGTADAPPLYTLRSVAKTLEKAGASFTLHIDQLVILPGEFLAFVGESGCGKTTLLDLLGLISTPTSFNHFGLHFGGEHVPNIVTTSESRLAELRRRYLGYVLQTGGLLPFLTIGANILLPSHANGEDNEEDGRLLARQLGIEDQWFKKPAFLSGGQRQRAAIARSLIHRPAVVLADEPTGAVDKHSAFEIRRLLHETAAGRGAAVLVVTHDEALVANVTNRVFTFEVESKGARVDSYLVESSWKARRPSGAVL